LEQQHRRPSDKQCLFVSAARQSQIPNSVPVVLADIDFLRQEAERGNPVAQREHACRLSRDGNMPGAAKYFKLAANQGFVTGHYTYDVCLLNGYGVSINRREASEYFKLAADQGFANAQ
jgi:TPR repeat protein